MNQRKHNKSSSLSFTANAVFSLLSTVTLSPTSILMLEVLCQSARHGLLHFYSAAVLPVLPTSVTVSCLITNIHPALWLCRFLALHKIKCQWGVSISWDQSFKSWLLSSMLFMTHALTNVLGRLWYSCIWWKNWSITTIQWDPKVWDGMRNLILSCKPGNNLKI